MTHNKPYFLHDKIHKFVRIEIKADKEFTEYNKQRTICECRFNIVIQFCMHELIKVLVVTILLIYYENTEENLNIFCLWRPLDKLCIEWSCKILGRFSTDTKRQRMRAATIIKKISFELMFAPLDLKLVYKKLLCDY